MSAIFAAGLSGVVWGLLPGDVKFKKAGITAVGAIALFLALLFWLKPGPGHDHDVSRIFLEPRIVLIDTLAYR